MNSSPSCNSNVYGFVPVFWWHSCMLSLAANLTTRSAPDLGESTWQTVLYVQLAFVHLLLSCLIFIDSNTLSPSILDVVLKSGWALVDEENVLCAVGKSKHAKESNWKLHGKTHSQEDRWLFERSSLLEFWVKSLPCKLDFSQAKHLQF